MTVAAIDPCRGVLAFFVNHRLPLQLVLLPLKPISLDRRMFLFDANNNNKKKDTHSASSSSSMDRFKIIEQRMIQIGSISIGYYRPNEIKCREVRKRIDSVSGRHSLLQCPSYLLSDRRHFANTQIKHCYSLQTAVKHYSASYMPQQMA